MNFPPSEYLDFSQTDHAALFTTDEPVWSALGLIGSYLEKILNRIESPLIRGTVHEGARIGTRVYVGAGATVEANAFIKGPAWIGSDSVVRSGAYVRENVIVGNNCILGNSSEFKNCLLFNQCEVPHFNYVGDSILGYKAHLGAGVICSNVRLDRRNVSVRNGEGGLIDTGLKKLGAVIGDRTEVGCNSVLSPGSILGRECIIYPLTSWQGVLRDRQIVKSRQALQIVAQRD